jgi:hypothetical protein
MYDNRLVYNLGDGNRQNLPQNGSDHTRVRFNTHIAVSQVVQELPVGDYFYWERCLFLPETLQEGVQNAQNRVLRGFGGPGDTGSTLHASSWALARLENGQNHA